MATKRDVVTSSHVEDDHDSSVVEDISSDDCTHASSKTTACPDSALPQSTSIARLDRFPARIAGLTGWPIAEARVLQVICINVLEELRCFEETAWYHRTAKQKQAVYDLVRARMSALQGVDVQQKHWNWLIEDVCRRLYTNHKNRRSTERREKAKRVVKASNRISPQQPTRTVEQLVTAKMERLLKRGLEPDLAMRLVYKAIQKALPEATDASQKAHCNLKDGEASSSHHGIDGRAFRWFKPALRKMAFQHEDTRSSFHAKAEDVASRAYQAAKGAVEA